jgi:calcineurin-like phosphoesterase
MKFLFIGDIVGSFGRMMVAKHLPRLKQELNLDFVIANAENASHGKTKTKGKG